MKTAKILLAALIITGIFGGSCLAAPSDSARSSVLIDGASGKIIFEKNARERLGPASTTKIMTALVALENMPPETKIKVDPRAVGVEGSSAYLRAGDEYTLSELIYAMMLSSANDAAAAIAYAVGGDIGGFADMMNEKANRLGLCDTHFENPHGLDGEEHFTTAYDLALIARAALGNELFRAVVSTKNTTIGKGETCRALHNHNRLLFEYDDIIGVKTGFTKRCGRTLVSAARRDGVTLICVTLGDGDDWRDHRRLLDAGFELYENVTVCEKNDIFLTVRVCGGENEKIGVTNDEIIQLYLPKNRGEIKVRFELPEFVYAPVTAGDIIGRAVFSLDGEDIASAELISVSDCPKTQKKNFFERLLPWKK